MRLAAIASALAIALCVAVFGAIRLQKASFSVPAPAPSQATPTEGRRAPPSVATVEDNAPERSPTPAAQAVPMPAAMPTSCSNPNALGVSRVVEIDTTGGPGFGFEHFKAHDFLREGEVVLTFDDGPWPKNTPAHQGDLLPDRPACHLPPRDPQAGGRSRARHRLAHLVSPGSVENQG